VRQQVKRLEHESQQRVAQLRGAVFAEPAGVVASEGVAPALVALEQPEDGEQRRLARARRAHDGDELAARDAQAGAV
jgi:hypothetical protein